MDEEIIRKVASNSYRMETDRKGGASRKGTWEWTF